MFELRPKRSMAKYLSCERTVQGYPALMNMFDGSTIITNRCNIMDCIDYYYILKDILLDFFEHGILQRFFMNTFWEESILREEAGLMSQQIF
jgi:hypothetical protein